MSIKFSAGLALVVKWKWSTKEIKPYADHVLELFGSERTMSGSNWPVVELGGKYSEVWHGLNELIAHLSSADRDAVLGGSATRIYRL